MGASTGTASKQPVLEDDGSDLAAVGQSAACPEPLVVALTGGPAAGKSSALTSLRARFSNVDIQVITVPETATHFFTNSDGMQVLGADVVDEVRMQRIFFEYQLAQEDAFLELARLQSTKPALLVLDRCALDSRVFLGDEKWLQMLTLPGKRKFSEPVLLRRYDVLIHLHTCAGHAEYSWGIDSSNPTRHHSADDAKALDERTGWVIHDHTWRRVAPYMTSLEEHMEAVYRLVHDALRELRDLKVAARVL